MLGELVRAARAPIAVHAYGDVGTLRRWHVVATLAAAPALGGLLVLVAAGLPA